MFTEAEDLSWDAGKSALLSSRCPVSTELQTGHSHNHSGRRHIHINLFLLCIAKQLLCAQSRLTGHCSKSFLHILLLLTQIEAYIKILFFPHEAIEHRSLIVTVEFTRASTLTLTLREMLFTYIHTLVLYNNIA